MTDIEALENKYKVVSQRHAALTAAKNRVEAALAERKRSLKDTIDECRKAGFNPDTLQNDIDAAKSALSSKLEKLEFDLNEAEKILKPLLSQLDKV